MDLLRLVLHSLCMVNQLRVDLPNPCHLLTLLPPWDSNHFKVAPHRLLMAVMEAPLHPVRAAMEVLHHLLWAAMVPPLLLKVFMEVLLRRVVA